MLGRAAPRRKEKHCALNANGQTLASGVDNNLPIVTIIIAARPDESEVRAVTAARQLDYPPDKLEILLARGRQPSVQRNVALRAARGELIYFLDDDSRPDPKNLRRAAEMFKSPDVKMVGGPNLCPPDAPAIEQAFALTMATRLAFSSSAARYHAVGRVRPTSEKELILCNLLARRDAMLELGGFDESLYPNEENALMDDLQKRGGTLLYDPDLVVHRRPRANFWAFCKMLRSYGRGRAEQVRLHPTLRSLPNFVPPLFCLFLAALPFLPARCDWLMAIYALGLFFQAVAILPLKKMHWFPLIMFLIFTCHVCYGLGFWLGCVTRPKPPPPTVAADVKLEKP